MSKLRFRVVESAFEKKATELTTPAERPSEYYGELVFNREKMFKYLQRERTRDWWTPSTTVPH